jgi:hypothetical protein
MQGSLVAAKDTSTKRTGGHWGRDRRRSSVSNTAELALVVQCARHSFRETAAQSFLSWIYGPSESQSVMRYICAVPVTMPCSTPCTTTTSTIFRGFSLINIFSSRKTSKPFKTEENICKQRRHIGAFFPLPASFALNAIVFIYSGSIRSASESYTTSRDS